jgi:hypothetical protein
MKTLAILLSLFCVPFAYSLDVSGGKPDADALAKAIISSNWSWESSANGTKNSQEIQFYQDGFTENSTAWTARWSVAGPQTLVIENTKPGARYFGRKAYLVFNASLSHFIGFDFNGKTTVEGFRRESVDPTRKPREVKD